MHLLRLIEVNSNSGAALPNYFLEGITAAGYIYLEFAAKTRLIYSRSMTNVPAAYCAR